MQMAGLSNPSFKNISYAVSGMKTFSARGKVANTVFHKNDLLELEKLLTEKEDGLRISEITMYFDHRQDEGRVEVDTLAELTEEEYAGFTNNPTHVKFVAHGWEDRKIRKSAYVDVYKESTKFSMNSSDQKWVFGLKEQVQRFLKARQRTNYTDIGQMVFGSLLGLLVIPGLNAFVRGDNARALNFAMFWLIGGLSWSYSVWWSVYRKPPKIYINEKPIRKVDYHLIVAVIGVILAGVGVLVTLFQ